ncbi:DNA helicase [Tanacetum coccineum]
MSSTAHLRFKFPLDPTDTTTLPVKKSTTRDEIIQSSVAKSYIWRHFKLHYLMENMCLNNEGLLEVDRERVSAFAQWLLDVGNVHIGTPDESDPENTSWIDILDDESGVPNLIRFIYDDDTLQYPTAVKLQEKTIVCPKNDTADAINGKILSMLSRRTHTYISVDEAIPHSHDGGEVELLYPKEYLNTLSFVGLPPHMLELKVGTSIMLLRNVNIVGGLCNGTRLIVKQLLSKKIVPDKSVLCNDNKQVPRSILEKDRSVPPLNMFSAKVLRHRRWRQPVTSDRTREDKGKMIVAKLEITNFADLRLIHCNKTIEATAYRISGFSCEQIGPWERTLENPTYLIFGRFIDLQEISNDGFLEHYFNFATYNELPARVDVKNAILTDYVGRIQIVSRIYTSGDATTNRTRRRTINIQNLSGNIIGLTLWHKMAMNFNVQEYESMEKLVVIVVSSCWLSGTSATQWHLSPNIPQTYQIKQLYQELADTKTILNIDNQRYEDLEQEKNGNQFPLAALLEVNPQNYQGSGQLPNKRLQ